MSRRFFLKSTGAMAVYCGVSPMDLLAASPTTQPADASVRPAVVAGRTLVVIFLRGGMDGLNFITPWKDPGYASLRRSLALQAPGRGDAAVLDLDGFFGLHPRAAALRPLFEQQLAVAMHAVGYDKNTRSHFEEQDTWETGIAGNTIHSDGWLNRHLATSEGQGVIRAVAIGDSLPRILQGEAPAYAIRGLDQLALPSGNAGPDAVTAALEHAYQPEASAMRSAAEDLLSDAGQATLEGVRQLRKVAAMNLTSQVTYPSTGLGRKLETAARLIRSGIGVEVIEVDLDGWDTHQYQGDGAGGPFGNLVEQLATAVDAFTRDLADRMDDVLLLTLSDFGRTAAENGSRGTDHGWGNCLLAVGGGVQAASAKREKRPVIGDWPGLAPDQLHQGRDLLHTTDFRDVIAEVVQGHLGNPRLKDILPGHDFMPAGLLSV